MGSQALSILRQGVWASLTGGWFYDPRQSHFSNVFHLYIWLLLLCLPLGIQVTIQSRHDATSNYYYILWAIYCFSIMVLFIATKLINAYLHNLFDAGECVTEDDIESQELSKDDDVALEPLHTTELEERTITKSSQQTEDHLDQPDLPDHIAPCEPEATNSDLEKACNEIDEAAKSDAVEKDKYERQGARPKTTLRMRVVGHSTDDDRESDVSLVVNIPVKSRKKKTTTPKVLRERRNVRGRKPTPNTINVQQDSWPVATPSGASGYNPASPAYTIVAAFPVNDGDTTTSSDASWTSKSQESAYVSSSQTESGDENVALTRSLAECGASSKAMTNLNIDVSPDSSDGYDRSEELKNRISDILSKKNFLKRERELKKLRAQLDSKRRRRHQQQLRRLQEHEQSRANRVEDVKGPPEKDVISTQLPTSEDNGPVIASADGPPAYMLAKILSVPGTHLAHTHEDTTTGAVHCFQDEKGKWLTYTFDEHSMGSARGLNSGEGDSCKVPFDVYASNVSENKWGTSSSSSESAVVTLNMPASILPAPCTSRTLSRYSPRPRRTSSSTYGGGKDENNSNHNLARLFANTHSANGSHLFSEMYQTISPNRPPRRLEIPPNMSLGNRSSAYNSNLPELTFSALRFSDFASPDIPPAKPKQYFKLWLPPILKWTYIKVRFDRLHLLALLDKSLSNSELVLSIVLAVMVAVCGAYVVQLGIFKDILLFLFCFVIASCHYTLLKSVQPDAASPTHGYNRTIIYSRPIYFTFGCLVILLCHLILSFKTNALQDFKIYGVALFSPAIFWGVMEAAKVFVLSFPLIFSLGLLPQINTFFMYLFEQIDIHVFGGTAATTGLSSAVYAITRSVCTVFVLYIIAIASLWRVYFTSPKRGNFSSQDYDVMFSVFAGILVSAAYHLSRSSSDPTVLWAIIKRCFTCRRPTRNRKSTEIEGESVEMKVINSDSTEDSDGNKLRDYKDPLPKKMEKTLTIRLQNDLIICVLITIIVFAVHVSTIFTLQPIVEICLTALAIVWGFVLHYFMKHFRKEHPWLCFARPILKPREYDVFEVKDEARLMWFEWLQAWLWLLEKNAIYPLVFLSAITNDTPAILDKFGFFFGTLIIVICGFKCIRSSLNDASYNYITLMFTYLIFEYDLRFIREAFLINYFVASIATQKLVEMMLKIKFVVTYVAPWQITWGSAFHAFAQPFSVPHSAMLLVQAALSSILSSPLQPVLGSAIFLTSYVRPIKFWERDYNTMRVDHSNTRLASQLDRNQLGTDDNNLNSIFYEHLTRSLQTSLYGDLALGRWGQVSQGDCYVLASDNLNCLVHIIELGNGMVTFQVRGLEFRGTYCQQREVEALSEGVSEDDGCCCCEPGHIPSMLSMNAAFNQRWLAWEVTHTKYVLEGYSISDNSAVSMLQPYDLRKALLTYYVKAVIFYTITNKRLGKWIANEAIKEALEPLIRDKTFVDLDPTFNLSVDEDFDFRASGITRTSFCHIYLSWIKHCLGERVKTNKILDADKETSVVNLCFALSLLARRALSAASHHNSFSSVEFLLYGLHALFKGDFRITSARDEWVFQDIELLKQVISPAVRMAVKLHQDHVMSTDEYDESSVLYAAIINYQENMVISHEADPSWRNAVLSNVDSLLALRHVFDDGTDQYKILMLNKRYLSFRLIKVNRECVRGLWAGQQQELIYLRNRNPERGSIQNAKQALRNIINSSCDQPIGYPIYVSPLTTSFAETSTQLCKVIGQPFSFSMFKIAALRFWTRVKVRCGEGCSSGGPGLEDDMLGRSGGVATCRRHRHDVFAFDRNLGARGSRESHSSDRSSEIDSNQLLHRRHQRPSTASSQSAIPSHLHPYPRKVSARRQHSSVSSTLVNISAFKPNSAGEIQHQQLTGLDVELGSFGTVTYRANPSTTVTQSQPPAPPVTTVTVTAIDSSSGSLAYPHPGQGDLV